MTYIDMGNDALPASTSRQYTCNRVRKVRSQALNNFSNIDNAVHFSSSLQRVESETL